MSRARLVFEIEGPGEAEDERVVALREHALLANDVVDLLVPHDLALPHKLERVHLRHVAGATRDTWLATRDTWRVRCSPSPSEYVCRS